MLEKLTKQQEELMVGVRQEWLDKIFKYGLQFDEDKARKGIEWLYQFSKLKKPIIVFVESPLACQYAVQYVKALFKILKEKGVKVKDIKGDQVWVQVGAQVWAQVWDQVRAQVGAQVGAQVENSSKHGNIWDYGWNSFYDFFDRIKIDLGKGKNNFYKFKELLNSGIYDMIQLDGLCVVCKLPSNITRNEQNRLHNETGFAIEWKDGYGQNYIHGVFFKPELFKQVIKKSFGFKKIMELGNIEQRMAVLKLKGAEYLLKNVKAKLLDKSKRGNELYLVEKVFNQPAYFLKYKDKSTDRVYVSGIDPEVGKQGKADLGMAWKFDLQLEDYNNLKQEA